MTAETGTREYRVMWWSKAHGQWYPHTGISTDRPQVAEAWLEQAIHRGPGGEPTEAFIESRLVTPWTRDTPPAPTHAAREDRAAMSIDPEPPGVTLRPFTPSEAEALDAQPAPTHADEDGEG